MSLVARYLVGIPAAVVVGMFGGPVVAYLAWKGTGVATTGNPIYFIPGTSALGDGMTALGDLADVSDGPDHGGDDWWRRRG